MSAFTDDELARVVATVDQFPTQTAAASHLGLSESGLRRRLKVAIERNMTGAAMGGPLQPGYKLGKITSLFTADGRMMEWRHALPGAENLQETLDLIEETLADHVKPLDLILPPHASIQNWMVVYPDADLHLGMYAWKKETGENYDLEIAAALLQEMVQKVYSQTPNTETCLILDLGDGMHADNNNAVTEKSHAHLDVDSRFDKVLHKAIELVLWKIDLALQKHNTVYYRRMRGNHDNYAARAVEAGVYYHYLGNPRVIVDRAPGEFYFQEFGNNMIAAHHGHLIAPSDMPQVMASYQREMWGRTEFHYAYLGHFHRKRKGQPMVDETGGAIWEVFETIAPKDAWNRSVGHSANRSMKAIVLDKEEGEIMTINRNVRPTNG